jgi:ammonia channel protein AmtB
MAVVLVVLSRLVTAPGGYVAGSVAQLLVVACGVVVPLMYALGVLFAVLWVVSLRLGARIDRERAEYDAAHPDEAGTAG